MSDRLRLGMFGVALAGLLGLLVWGFAGLPDFGDYQGPYGFILDKVAVPERSTTDVVTAVNFDYRGLDTIGEEYILFVSAAGVALLLRRQRREAQRAARDEAAGRRVPPTTDAVRLLCLLLVAPTSVLGLYVVAHGQLTPGGGFQGGVVLATALLLVYLAGRYPAMEHLGSPAVIEIGEAVGAGGFVLVGLGALLAGGAFLENLLPRGISATLTAGGTVAVISACIGLEVAAGVLLIAHEFLLQTLRIRGGGRMR